MDYPDSSHKYSYRRKKLTPKGISVFHFGCCKDQTMRRILIELLRFKEGQVPLASVCGVGNPENDTTVLVPSFDFGFKCRKADQ